MAQVGEAVTQMDQATQQNAALVEEMAAAADSLKTQAQDLVSSVSVFKLSHDQGGGMAYKVASPRTMSPQRAPAVKAQGSLPKGKPGSGSHPKPPALEAPVAATAKAGGDDWESF